MYNRRYDKVFVMLRQETNGFASGHRPAWGSCVMEIKNGKGRITATVQGIKKLTDNRYYALFVVAGKMGVSDGICCGKLEVDDYGRGELKWDFDPENVGSTGYGIEEIHTLAILVRGKENYGLTAPLAGYFNEKRNWQKHFKEYRPKVKEETVFVNEERKKEEPEEKEPIIVREEKGEQEENLVVMSKEEKAEQEENLVIMPKEEKEEQEENLVVVPMEEKSEQEETISIPSISIGATGGDALPFPETKSGEDIFAAEAVCLMEDAVEEAAAHHTSSLQSELNQEECFEEEVKEEIKEQEPKKVEEPKAEEEMKREDVEELKDSTLQGEEESTDFHKNFKGLLMNFQNELEKLEKIGVFTPEDRHRIEMAGEGEGLSKKEREENKFDVLFMEHTAIEPFADENGWWKCIAMEELILLPLDCLFMMKHNFFRLSFRKYKHYIFGKRDSGYYLGIPDRYEPENKRLAEKLGFLTFEPYKGHSVEKGCPGYWLQRINNVNSTE